MPVNTGYEMNKNRNFEKSPMQGDASRYYGRNTARGEKATMRGEDQKVSVSMPGGKRK